MPVSVVNSKKKKKRLNEEMEVCPTACSLWERVGGRNMYSQLRCIVFHRSLEATCFLYFHKLTVLGF